MIIEDDNLLFGIKKEFFVAGLILSVCAHLSLFLLAALRISNVKLEHKINEPMVVYSVSIEGGKRLGGIAQVSKTGKKEPLVPYKNVESTNAPAPKLEASGKAEVSIKDTAKEEAEKKAKALKEQAEKEKAEISLREEKAKEEKRLQEEKAKKAKAEAERQAKEKAAKEEAAKQEAAKKEAAKKEAERQAREQASKATKGASNKNTSNKNARPDGVVGGTGTGSGTANLDTKLQKALQRYLGESSDAGGVGFGAAKVTGGDGMGGGVVRPPEFFEYKDVLVKHIKANWNWFDTSKPYKAQVQMSIDPKGNITKHSITTSSGNGRFDQSLLRAIEKSSPVPAPPSNVYEFFKDVRVIFDPRD
ncbi:MAG: cell envelope integrity protein TolA [Bdellovibrionota bacterium]